jgi:hypothetical protein
MGFKSLLEQQVQGVMQILGQDDGLAPFCVYVEKGARSYDTDTRTYSTVDTNHTNIPMVLAKFKIDEMDDEVVSATDLKAIIAKLDIPVDPKTQDQIIDDKGATYNVERLMGVPGESLYILHVRKV